MPAANNSTFSTLLKLIVLALPILEFSCKPAKSETAKGNFKNSDLYDFNSPFVISLPPDLDEISGIAFYPKDTSLFAIVDEAGILYKIPVNNPKNISTWIYDDKGDFEDIVLKDSAFYILKSNGDVLKVWFEGNKPSKQKFDFSEGSKKKNEFEGMFIAKDSFTIVVMCKDCKEDGKNKVSFLGFDSRDDSAAITPAGEIEVLPIAEALKDKKLNFKPSAAAINPVTQELYIVSAINKCIVILTPEGVFKEVIELNPKLYKQPEGIAFTPQGDLMISNEVFLEGYANILIMKNKMKK